METFDDIIKGDKPVLVDFFATWCGPCKVLSPTVEALGKELAGQVRVLKIDVDKNEALARQLRIQSVPTLIIFTYPYHKNLLIAFHLLLPFCCLFISTHALEEASA